MQTLTILLAEDEPLIALELRQWLEPRNVRVLEAGDPAGLPALCRQAPPDLVLLNFLQPGPDDGMALAALLKRQYRLRVMFITGARPQDLAASPFFDPGLTILYKPFTRVQLLRCLAGLVAEI